MDKSLIKFIYGNPLFCFLLLFPFVEPLYFTNILYIDTIYLYTKLMSITVVIIMWLMKPTIDKVMGSISIFLAVDCAITVINQGNTSQMFTNALTLITMSLMFMTAAKCHSIAFLKSARLLFEILIYANFAVIVLFPEGIYNFSAANAHYLLGHKNVMMRTIFPGVCIGMISSMIEYEKIDIRAKVLAICAGASLVLAKSGTAIFSYFIFIGIMLFFQKRELPKWLNVKKCYIIAVSIFFLVVVFGFQNLFSFFIVDILHKDLSFTGRTILWKSAITYIFKRPIFGYGLEYLSVIAPKLYRFSEYDSAHNFFLDVLYQNGVFGAALMVGIFIAIAKAVDNNSKSGIRKLFTLIIMTYAIMINFEPFINGDMRLFIPLMIYIYYFSRNLVYKDNSKHIDEKILLGKRRRRKFKIVFFRQSTLIR